MGGASRLDKHERLRLLALLFSMMGWRRGNYRWNFFILFCGAGIFQPPPLPPHPPPEAFGGRPQPLQRLQPEADVIYVLSCKCLRRSVEISGPR